ncbi:MAG: hypothetical protein KGO02_08840 [Alphaproteobacteria bacterium]|nr:hypothetical protein [Alphaproteobacteria bacterium]
MRSLGIAAVMAGALALVGCGTTTSDRALSGAGIGAAGGAIIGAMTGTAASGALIGAAAGALTGAVTNPCQLDLGSPFWKHHGGRRGYERRCHH